MNVLVLDSSVIKNLINEVARPSLTRSKNGPSSSSLDSKSYSMLSTSYKKLNSHSTSKIDAETDSLGFYLNSPRSRCHTPVGMLSITKLNSTCPLSNSCQSESEQDEGNLNIHYFYLLKN